MTEQINADETTQPRTISQRVVVERHAEVGNAVEVFVAGDQCYGVFRGGRRDECITGFQRFAGSVTSPVEFAALERADTPDLSLIDNFPVVVLALDLPFIVLVHEVDNNAPDSIVCHTRWCCRGGN